MEIMEKGKRGFDPQLGPRYGSQIIRSVRTRLGVPGLPFRFGLLRARELGRMPGRTGGGVGKMSRT